MALPRDWASIRRFFAELWKETNRDNILDYAGSLAYSWILALFPFLLFVVALAGIVIDPATVDRVIAQVYRVAPPQVAELITGRMLALTGARPALLTLGAIGAVWAASGGVSALMSALNAVYNVEETRPFWRTRGLSLLVTLTIALLAILASAVALLTPVVAHVIGSAALRALLWLRWPVAAALMNLGLAALYWLLPNVKLRFRLVTPGSVVAVLLWILASLGFTLYVSNFGSYEVIYGALGSVIVLLLWMWLTSLAVLLGAEIDAVLDQLGRERATELRAR